MKRFFYSIFLLLNILAALCLIGAYASTKISPGVSWHLAFLGLAYPYILFVNILFILFWLFVRPSLSLISLMLIAVGYVNTGNYFQFLKTETESKGLDILSYNVQCFFGGKEKTIKKQLFVIATYLEQEKCDIICLQEASYAGKIYGDWKDEFKDIKLPQYGISMGGQVIMSRYPIISSKKQDFDGTGNNFIYADIKISDDTLRVYNCHLQSYAFTNDDISLLDSLAVDDKVALMKDARIYASKLKRGFIKRAEQVEALRKSIDESPYSVIVCGDFNDTPVSYTYNKVLGDDLCDAFVESGNGVGNTYHGKLPSFRIDYIFHSSRFKSYNFQIGEEVFSDHYSIKTRIVDEKNKSK